MNLGRVRVVVRERNVLEVVDLACRFTFGLGGRLYVRLFCLIGLPSWGLCFWALSSGIAPSYVWLLGATLFWMTQVPFTIVASRLMFSEDATLRAALIPSIRVFVRSMMAMIVIGVLFVIGALSVVLLPIVIGRTLYLREIILLEGTDIRASLARSGRFTKGRTGQAVAVWVLLLALTCAFVGVVEILAAAVTRDALGLEAIGGLSDIARSPAAFLGLFVSAPFVATARFLAYIDGRTRREAWDVQVRFLNLVADEQARAA